MRPSDVVLDEAGPLLATAVLAERLGHEAQLFCDAPTGRFVANIDKAQRFTPGQEVRFSAPAAKIHVFDAATEIRL